MKYLLQAIEARRDCVDLSDAELTRLLTDVQRARDDRSLLLDSLERLLHDLRAQSHAAAFLARVNKRDAPDYYDIIKNPMDLGLMLKNVKSGKYRTKEAFRKDLDLIWDNCLIYNTEPTHPLRLSAELMRKRSHDLLSYIQDSNDVKSALSEWVATHTTLTPAEAKALQSKDAPPAHIAIASQPLRFLTPSAAANEQPAAGPSSTPTKPKRIRPPPNEPLEMRTAFTVGTGSSLADGMVRERQRLEQDTWALRRLVGAPWIGALSRPDKGKDKLVQPIFESREEEEEVSQMVTRFSTGQASSFYGDFEEAEDFDGPSTSEYILPQLSASLSFVPQKARLRRQRRRDDPQNPNTYPGDTRMVNGYHDVNGSASRSTRKRGVDVMKGNIKTLKRMKRIKDKFDFLDHCLDNDQPVPSRLLMDSDDEEDDAEGSRTEAGGEGSVPPHGQVGVEEQGATNPLPHIALDTARNRLRDSIGLICGNIGFNGSQQRAQETLTTITEEFLSSLGRTLRLYVDRYGSRMSREEIILHTLHATGKVGVAELDKYLHEYTPRYEQRLLSLKTKLQDSWKERIAIGEDRLVTEEDARFFGEESDDLLAGNLPSAFEDDFFGFKAMGLEAELGVANLTIPARLLQRRGGARGLGHSQIGKGEEEDKDLFPPPIPFIRLSEAAVPAQIGLLQDYYNTLLHRRGHRGRATDKDGSGQGQGGEEDDDDDSDGLLSISDDEQERTSRYKVPPTGKMPKRDFWTNVSPSAAKSSTGNASSGGATSGGGGGATGSSGGGKSSSGGGKSGGSGGAKAANTPATASTGGGKKKNKK